MALRVNHPTFDASVVLTCEIKLSDQISDPVSFAETCEEMTSKPDISHRTPSQIWIDCLT